MLRLELGSVRVFVDARRVETGRKHGRRFRGGLISYSQLAGDLTRWMKQDRNPESWFTTMFDLYKLPSDFPGYADCRPITDPRKRVECLEEKFRLDVEGRFGDDPIHQRIVPYIQLHEFEALLFSDPAKFLDVFPAAHSEVKQLRAVAAQYESPEDIDDGETTAPSKRILSLLPNYVKPVSGILIARGIGLSGLRSECPHFRHWFERLSQLDSIV